MLHSHTNKAPEIQAAFVPAGSLNKRNLHLRAISAIAQVGRKKRFERRWFEASTERRLRDIILLSSRDRPERGNRPEY